MKLRYAYYLNAFFLGLGLLSVPINLIIQMRRSAKFAAMHPEANCSYIGILYLFLIFGFFYLLVFLNWNAFMGSKPKNHFWSWFQFICIFILGALPGLFLAFWGFVAD